MLVLRGASRVCDLHEPSRAKHRWWAAGRTEACDVGERDREAARATWRHAGRTQAQAPPGRPGYSGSGGLGQAWAWVTRPWPPRSVTAPQPPQRTQSDATGWHGHRRGPESRFRNETECGSETGAKVSPREKERQPRFGIGQGCNAPTGLLPSRQFVNRVERGFRPVAPSRRCPARPWPASRSSTSCCPPALLARQFKLSDWTDWGHRWRCLAVRRVLVRRSETSGQGNRGQSEQRRSAAVARGVEGSEVQGRQPARQTLQLWRSRAARGGSPGSSPCLFERPMF